MCMTNEGPDFRDWAPLPHIHGPPPKTVGSAGVLGPRQVWWVTSFPDVVWHLNERLANAIKAALSFLILPRCGGVFIYTTKELALGSLMYVKVSCPTALKTWCALYHINFLEHIYCINWAIHVMFPPSTKITDFYSWWSPERKSPPQTQVIKYYTFGVRKLM